MLSSSVSFSFILFVIPNKPILMKFFKIFNHKEFCSELYSASENAAGPFRDGISEGIGDSLWFPPFSSLPSFLN